MTASAVFRKLNLKEQQEILVLNAPSSFESEIDKLEDVELLRDLAGKGTISFTLCFVTMKAQVDSLASSLAKRARGDVILWFAYPKASSKRYQCDFNRDTGWAMLGELGFEGVRQVAIDEDWSALRFRRVEFIKSFNRDASRALSAKGQKRATRK